MARPSKSISVLFVAIILAVLICFAPVSARAEMQDYPRVKLRSLDKITARTMTFEAKVGSTVKYGPLYIKIQACRKAPPIEQPESAAFLQIWEVTATEKAKWVFSGWMFASSPALSSMDHPIYDVWVIDCLGDFSAEEDSAEVPEEGEEAESAADNEAPAETGSSEKEE